MRFEWERKNLEAVEITPGIEKAKILRTRVGKISGRDMFLIDFALQEENYGAEVSDFIPFRPASWGEKQACRRLLTLLEIQGLDESILKRDDATEILGNKLPGTICYIETKLGKKDPKTGEKRAFIVGLYPVEEMEGKETETKENAEVPEKEIEEGIEPKTEEETKTEERIIW
jgi:hypothetical protein